MKIIIQLGMLVAGLGWSFAGNYEVATMWLVGSILYGELAQK